MSVIKVQTPHRKPPEVKRATLCCVRVSHEKPMWSIQQSLFLNTIVCHSINNDMHDISVVQTWNGTKIDCYCRRTDTNIEWNRSDAGKTVLPTLKKKQKMFQHSDFGLEMHNDTWHCNLYISRSITGTAAVCGRGCGSGCVETPIPHVCQNVLGPHL